MTNASTITMTSHSPETTANWAVALAEMAAPGVVICLWGEVGSGKTFLARHMIQHLQSRHGTPEDVPSPTFTLVQTYDAGTLEIWHADLYRLSSVDESYELGLISAFDGALCLVEWPDRLGTVIPRDALHMRFEHGQDVETRHCNVTCDDAKRFACCAALLSEFADV